MDYDKLMHMDQHSTDIEVHKVHIPAWNDDVYVKCPTAKQIDIAQSAIKKGNDRNWRAGLAASVLCDSAGKLIFDNLTLGTEVLGRRNNSAIAAITDEALEMAKMKPEDLEDEAENFDETLKPSSPSDSLKS